MNEVRDIELSVIIPATDLSTVVKNHMKMFQDCVNQPIEFILILDCEGLRPDNDSMRINREKFESELERENVKIYEGKFGNPGSARNAGISEAKGKWITFWDSDDFVHWETVFTHLKNVQGDEEVVIFDFSVKKLHESNSKDYKANGDLRLIALNPGIWRMVFRREIIADKRFPALRLGEDQCFLLDIGVFSRKAKLIGEISYLYNQGNPNQLTSQSRRESDVLFALDYSLKQMEYEAKRSYLSYIVIVRLFFTTMKKTTFKDKATGFFNLMNHFIFSSLEQKQFLIKAISFVIRNRESL